ncbi:MULTISPECIES: glucose-1-phosphate thymidylyltransferase [unclassified Streptomyces]|uniref:glucose-1-phosphate thymidylyltransferase n=1 Tax=unclassified Streptomyces TaxID=2593676 RepID=UPI002E79F4D8|nr:MULTISPECIES: glucose-1-phosphate thymidylyltransferase [unclassified Streptomyces]MEE1758249.1 glucose-1-phosphate thymidylyltransferase [Streptomyces sp. SP18BB07]MEE1832695.1 glucose-1-phosphate thymidylyltransferase [Streptomyces sp. SP17KL33]
MKALVLSGGTGSRMRPFTHSMAKQLLPVAGKPVLVHCVENIRDAGVTEIGVVVGSRAEQIADTLGDGSRWGVDLTYIRQEAPLGLAHGIAVAGDFLADDDFVLYLGDNVLAGGIEKETARFRADRVAAHLMVSRVDDPRAYGVAEVTEEGVVRRLTEKPAHPASDLAVIGVYFFTPAIHEAVRSVVPSARGELEITDAIQHLVDTGQRVTAGEYDDFWKDAGNPGDLLTCNRTLLSRQTGRRLEGEIDHASTVQGAVVVEPGARVLGSRLVGPLVVGANSTIRDSTLGPYTAVGSHCVVDGSRISEAILLEGAAVRDVPMLRHSVVGPRASFGGDGDARRPGRVLDNHADAEVGA